MHGGGRLDKEIARKRWPRGGLGIGGAACGGDGVWECGRGEFWLRSSAAESGLAGQGQTIALGLLEKLMVIGAHPRVELGQRFSPA